ncbi:hypothetical protein SV7mr_48120 [Stieleria bergensis]|uniref:Uncharacterized protein n=1 Tax=Stieleria bergensis TaxID=2528025 RepID=A0A517T1K6_9BACT|nr:hypothetical protein SV7mr_48120 [Planctomycetes bacterium SV_7m_r]
MLQWLRGLAKQWNDWVGDKDKEDAIRKHLTNVGFHGHTAKLRNVRLVAVQRPGWLQIYRFEALARVQLPSGAAVDGPDPEPQYKHVFGLVRDDIRKSICDVKTFSRDDERRALFRQWAEGLIQLRGVHGLGVSN